MEKLEKVELVREKSGVSYEEAREALEACDYEVLDALVLLEREGKVAAKVAEEPAAECVAEPVFDGAESRGTEAPKARSAWAHFCAQVKAWIGAAKKMTFVAEHGDERVVALPLLLVILGIFLWGASLWLLIIGLFFGLRYHIEGTGALVSDMNEVMGKAADVADDIKQGVA